MGWVGGVGEVGWVGGVGLPYLCQTLLVVVSHCPLVYFLLFLYNTPR